MEANEQLEDITEVGSLGACVGGGGLREGWWGLEEGQGMYY